MMISLPSRLISDLVTNCRPENSDKKPKNVKDTAGPHPVQSPVPWQFSQTSCFVSSVLIGCKIAWESLTVIETYYIRNI